MNQCSYCHVKVDSQHKNCPLCSGMMDRKSTKKDFTAYPSYIDFYEPEKVFTKKKLFVFISIVTMILSITINIFTYKTFPFFWSIIVAAGLLYTWIAIKSAFISKAHIGKRIFHHYLSLATFLFAIDFFTGFTKWSTNYVIPFLGMAATFILTVTAIARRSLWRDDAGYLMVMILVNILPLLGLLLKLNDVVWTSVAALIYAIISLVGMFVFADKKFIEEVKKRFHL